MPRRESKDIYKFHELSPEAKEKALEYYRRIFSEVFDPDELSDQFKSILEERGLKDAKLSWSLGYSQGDGVAFSGYLNVPEFFNWALVGDDPKYKKLMRSKVKPFLDLERFVGVGIRDIGTHYHHWNSMEIDVSIVQSPIDLVSRKMYDQVLRYVSQRQEAKAEYERAKYSVAYERNRPISEWEKEKRRRDAIVSQGPTEWAPLRIMPSPIDIPDPVLKQIQEPKSVKAALDKAEAEFARLEAMIPEFENMIEEWAKDTSRELEKMGYAEIEYQSSDEYIQESIEANKYEFEEDGTAVR